MCVCVCVYVSVCVYVCECVCVCCNSTLGEATVHKSGVYFGSASVRLRASPNLYCLHELMCVGGSACHPGDTKLYIHLRVLRRRAYPLAKQ